MRFGRHGRGMNGDDLRPLTAELVEELEITLVITEDAEEPLERDRR